MTENQGICSVQFTSHQDLEVEWWCGILPLPLFILSFQASVVPLKYLNCVLLKYHFDDLAISGNKMPEHIVAA